MRPPQKQVAPFGGDEIAAQMEWLSRNQSLLERRLEKVENSLIFRSLRAIGLLGGEFKQRILSLWPASSRQKETARSYRQWLARKTALMPSREWHVEEMGRWSYRPNVGVVLRMDDVRRECLHAAVESLFQQTYDRWQLLLKESCDLRPYVDETILRDPRVSRLSSANGDYVAFLGANDVLSPYALHYIVESLQLVQSDLIYTDEDFIDASGHSLGPNFKPDWSPTLLAQCMYLGNLMVVRRESLNELCDMDSLANVDLYELALRLGGRGGKIMHIPQVLYHRREVTSNSGEGPSRLTPVRQPVEDFGLTSIIICSRNVRLLEPCLRELQKTDYPSMEIVVVHHVTGDTTADDSLSSLAERLGCRHVRYFGPFNFAQMNNCGVLAASGRYLLFLNDDVRPLTTDWLKKIVAHFADAQVGIVGAKLLYPNGTIQHAGVTVGITDGVGHPGRGLFRSPFWKWLDYTREVTAVTGACLAIRREVFRELGGFDVCFPSNYNDVDLCLRARRMSHKVVIETTAPLCHLECQTRVGSTTFEERRLFFKRWASQLVECDPYYSPHLTREWEDAGLG
jgi:GT2 family glycosyltransferase